MRKILFASFIAVAVGTAPSPADADILLTPYAGVTFGAKSGDDAPGGPAEFDNRRLFGGSVAIVGASGLGFEADLGFVPDFFFDNDETQDSDLTANNVTTFMGNLMFVGTTGGIRPFVAGGAGLIRSKLPVLDAESNLGVNVGGGVLVGSGRLGLRGDVRYFRNVSGSDDSVVAEGLKDLRFWRGTIGVSIGF